MTNYYATTYNDPDGKVLQVSNDIDCLSCEALASPGILSRVIDKVYVMKVWAFDLARQFNCHHVEINCSNRKGSYQWLRL